MFSRLVLIAILCGAIATGCAAGSNTTTTSPAPLVAVGLNTDGLGDVLFGIDPQTVIEDISALFGGPDLDSDWIPATPNVYGTCPGTTMRAVGWGSLVVIFIDDASDLGGWFYTYTYGYDYAENEGGVDPRELDLRTPEGIGLGATVAELGRAFGPDLSSDGDTELDVWSFTAATAGFRGLLSGPDPEDTVTLLEPLVGCE